MWREARASWRGGEKPNGAPDVQAEVLRSPVAVAATAAGGVCPADVVYGGQHFSGIYRDSALHRGSASGRERRTGKQSAFRGGGQGDRGGGGIGWAGWKDRAAHQYRERFWPRDGFARRRDHFWDCTGGSRVYVGCAIREGRWIPAGSPRGLLHCVSVSAVRCGAIGAIQRANESGSQEPRARRSK